MFGKDFDGFLEQNGVEIMKVGPRAPNLNAFVEQDVASCMQLPRICADLPYYGTASVLQSLACFPGF
jgi:hypothetical protein